MATFMKVYTALQAIRAHSCVKACFLNLFEFLSARGILLRTSRKNCSCAMRVRTGGGVDSGRGALDWRWRWTLWALDAWWCGRCTASIRSCLWPQVGVSRVCHQSYLSLHATTLLFLRKTLQDSVHFCC